jgi:hypothetical protein
MLSSCVLTLAEKKNSISVAYQVLCRGFNNLLFLTQSYQSFRWLECTVLEVGRTL